MAASNSSCRWATLFQGTGHEVCVLDKLTYTGNLDNLACVAKEPRYRFAQADICDAPAVRAIIEQFRPEVVMHLAAESHVDRSIDRPAAFIETNFSGTFVHRRATIGSGSPISTRRTSVSITSRRTKSLARSAPPATSWKRVPINRIRLIPPPKPPPIILCALGTRVCSNCSNNYGPYHFPEKLIPLAILNALEGKPIP